MPRSFYFVLSLRKCEVYHDTIPKAAVGQKCTNLQDPVVSLCLTDTWQC